MTKGPETNTTLEDSEQLIDEDERMELENYKVVDRIHFGGLSFANSTFVSIGRCTHSDVMSTVTSVLKKNELQDLVLHSSTVNSAQGKSKRKGKKKVEMKKVQVNPLGLSISAAKLHRELYVERKMFMDALHRERSYRRQVEDGAASLIQAIARGFITRHRQTNEERESERDHQSNTWTIQQEHKIRRIVAQLQRSTEKLCGDLGDAALQKRRKDVTQANIPRHKLNQVVVRLQCFVRKVIALRVVQVALQYRMEEKEREAAICIQKRFRGFNQKQRKVRELSDEMDKAAIKIQALVRKKQDQAFVKMVREHLRRAAQETGAVTKIQNLLRRKIAKQELVKQKMTKASLVVQAGYRGYLARATVCAEKKKRQQSAVALQSAYRGHISRKSYQALRDLDQRNKVQAVTKMQALYRGNSGRKVFQKKKESHAATKIQGKFRQRQAKARVTAIKHDRQATSAATKIQSRIRGRMVRTALLKNHQ